MDLRVRAEVTPKPAAKQSGGLALQNFLSWGIQHCRGSSASLTDQFHFLPFLADREVTKATPRAAVWEQLPGIPHSQALLWECFRIRRATHSLGGSSDTPEHPGVTRLLNPPAPKNSPSIETPAPPAPTKRDYEIVNEVNMMFMNNKQFPFRWAPKASRSTWPGGNLEPSWDISHFPSPRCYTEPKLQLRKIMTPPHPPAGRPGAETRFKYNPDDPTAAVLASLDCI